VGFREGWTDGSGIAWDSIQSPFEALGQTGGNLSTAYGREQFADMVRRVGPLLARLWYDDCFRQKVRQELGAEFDQWLRELETVEGQSRLLSQGGTAAFLAAGSLTAKNAQWLQQLEQLARRLDGLTPDASTARAIGGARMQASIRLAGDEIDYIRTTFAELGGDVNKLRFNRGPHTGFDDDAGLFYIRGDILPLEGAAHPRSAMSVRAVLAHELGHEAHRGTTLARGAWNDEFRAGYWAVKNLNLPKQDQVHLIQDAIERAREANRQIQLNPLMREVLNP
jgi:hypothetical protein